MRAPAAPRRVRALAIALVVASALPAGSTHAQVAGQNINMVSGTKWPGGDPFLQRQNEPSLAVSSRNPLHLLAGANDYRTVDLPTDPGSIPGTLSGDAWLGVFKSFNGGLTWQSTLHPGFPQDKSAGSAGLNSPLKAYSAAADPTVRAGAAGLFFYSGIAFNRGTNIGAVFVSRFYDLNNKENGDATDPSQSKDPIAFVDTRLIDTGTSGQFIDKPWIAVDQPRGTTTCSIPVGGGVNIPAGNVYLAWSRFTGSSSTKIMFSRSTDCGKTWSTPTKLSESNSINQGTNVAIDPQTGNVFVVWRRFATSSQPDAILCAKSTDFGNSFASKNTSTIVNLGTGTAPNLWAFDQGSSEAQFRTNALPSMAVSVDFSVSPALSRVHAAFAARPSATGDARIYVSTSTDGLTWSTPTAADGLGITDDFGVTLTRGHQFMPQLTFSQGRLMLLYYDQRLDHTLGIAYPTLGFPDPATGKFYLFKRDPRGELLTNPNAVYTFTIADATPPLSVRRHTIDLRVASRRPSDAGFTATAVTQYKYGLRVDSLGDFVDETGAPAGSRALPPPLTQIQTNPPNLPLFAQGTIPFLGDYVDIAGPAFVSDGAGHWIFNTAPVAAPIFYATWTDNRDVIPPADGDWTHYTPVGGGGASVTDGQTITPTCASGQAGMRNQNIYVSRVSDGLIVNSLQNIKPLSPNQTRAFVVTMQNLTAQDRTFRMTLAPGPGVTASFLQGSALSSLDVTIGARLGAARPVFATSATVAGTIIVNVIEVTGPGGVVTPNPLQGAVVLNPEGSAAQLAQPDNAPPLSNGEIYTPSLSLINILNTNPFINILNANQNINILNPTTGAVTVSNPDPALINILNTDGSNADVSNASTSAINILNQDPAVINILNINILNSSTANTGISNINILNQTIGSINILNQTVGSINILNTPLSDATYRVTNAGNTAHSYRIALYGSNSNNVPLQVITTKTYSSPTASGCTLVQQNQNVRYSDVQNPLVATNLADATLPDIADSGIQNPTLSLAPGESAFVTLRGETDAAGMAQLVQQLTPVITAHGNPTGGNQFALLLFIQTTSGSLPVAVVGVPYNNGSGFAFQSAGGSGNVTWTPGGTLPTGLTLSPGGLLSGTPSAAGSFTFSVTATDSSPIPETTTQTISMTVMPRMTSTALTLSKNPVAVNEAVSATVTVSDIQVGGTKSFPSGTVTVGSGAVSGSCTLAPTATAGVATCAASLAAGASGSYPLTAAFPGTSIHAASSSSPAVLLAVNLRSTTTAVVLSPNPTTVLAPTTVTATVTDVSAGTPSSPAGLVTFSSSVPGDAFSPASCPPAPTTSTTSSCAVTLTPATNAARTVTASYGGSAVHAPSASGANLVVNAPLYTFLGFSSPLTTAGSLSAPSFSGSQNLGSAVPIKYQLLDSLGNNVTNLSATTSIQAVANSQCSGTPDGAAVLLYSPTVGATGGSTFRSSSSGFIFNWDTTVVVPNGPGCYTLVVQLNDGSAPKATTVRLK